MQVKKIAPRVWLVISGFNAYSVWMDYDGFFCNCPYGIRNPGFPCKHVKKILEILRGLEDGKNSIK